MCDNRPHARIQHYLDLRPLICGLTTPGTPDYGSSPTSRDAALRVGVIRANAVISGCRRLCAGPQVVIVIDSDSDWDSD